MAQNNAQALAQMQQSNLYQRQMLIATSPVFQKNLGTVTNGAPGAVSRIRLYNVGMLKRLILKVSMQVDIAVATATLSNKGPYNLISNLQLVDYAGNQRINISGAHLFEVNSARYRSYAGYNNEMAPLVLNTPRVPLTVGTNQELSFFIEVPVCYSDTDLRGLMVMQTNVGEVQLNITWNNQLVANGNDDAVYNGAPTTTVTPTTANNIQVTTIQEYFSPQANSDGLIYNPFLDTATVYELQGGIRSTDNLITGQERLISFPNFRSVIGMYLGYRNNSLGDSTNVRYHRMLVNGNNVQIDRPNEFQLWEQRRWRNSDTRPGQFSQMFRDLPVETSQLGNVQWAFTPGTITGVADLEMTWESFFTTGQMLPGLNQAQ